MYLTWKERIEVQPVFADINNWPKIDVKSIPKNKRKKFIRNKNLVGRVLKGEKLKTASYECNVSSPFVSYLLKRSLGGFDYEEPSLTSGLIPGVMINKGVRKTLLSKNNSSGTRGSFQYILANHQDIKAHLNKILKAYVDDKANGQNATPQSFHSEFLKLLAEKNWPSDQYPFDQANLARETCRKYYHRQINKLRLPKVRAVEIPLINTSPKYCYEEVELDSQLIDVSGSVVISVNGHETTVRLSRFALFVAIDVASNCILSYQLCISKEPTQFDLLTLLSNIHEKWKPREIVTPGANYEPGACIPSALSESFRKVGIGKIKLDNAMSHHANSIKEYVCEGLGATLNYGVPASPKARNTVEYMFKRLNKYIHRFKSTTGSHHRDRHKESGKLSKKPPILNLRSLEDFISIILTAHNVKPQKVLGGLTPLEVIQNHMYEYPLQLNFNNSQFSINPFIFNKKVKVYSYKNENRSPSISYSGLKYVGSGLVNVDLLDKFINISIDVRDIRQVKAYSMEGKLLGLLNAPKSWQSQPLSLTTLRYIKKQVKKEGMLSKDYLSGYFNELLDKKHQPKVATEIVRVARECGSNESTIKLSDNKVKNIEVSDMGLDHKNGIAKWSPKLNIKPVRKDT